MIFIYACESMKIIKDITFQGFKVTLSNKDITDEDITFLNTFKSKYNYGLTKMYNNYKDILDNVTKDKFIRTIEIFSIKFSKFTNKNKDTFLILDIDYDDHNILSGHIITMTMSMNKTKNKNIEFEFQRNG